MSIVYLLGSGFSKAIHPEMPTLTELSEIVCEKFKDELNEFPLSKYKDNFEELLTYLYTEHPWKNISTVHRDKALYYEVSSYIREIISDKQFGYSNGDNTEVITKLINKWNIDNDFIISFNYDTLVESYLNEMRKIYSNSNQLISIWRIPVVNFKNRIGKETRGDYIVRSPSLVKLHGSINWYIYGDITNNYSEIYYDDDIFRHPIVIPDYYVIDTHEHTGLIPFIIPPVMDKSIFYKNTMLKKLWDDAHRALNNASKVVIIGYSIPQTDYSSQMLLRSAIKDDTEIVIVNTDIRDEFKKRMKDIFGDKIKDDFKYCSDNALIEYINNEIQ